MMEHKAKGIGTYVLNEPTDGPGIRTYPYSVDMSIDPHTYADIANAVAKLMILVKYGQVFYGT